MSIRIHVIAVLTVTVYVNANYVYNLTRPNLRDRNNED